MTKDSTNTNLEHYQVAEVRNNDCVNANYNGAVGREYQIDVDFVKQIHGKVAESSIKHMVLGLRDEGLLESAVARQDAAVYIYGRGDIYSAPASLAYGLVKNHPFVDGNKRTAFISMLVVLLRIGWEWKLEGEKDVYTPLADCLIEVASSQGINQDKEVHKLADCLSKNCMQMTDRCKSWLPVYDDRYCFYHFFNDGFVRDGLNYLEDK